MDTTAENKDRQLDKEKSTTLEASTSTASTSSGIIQLPPLVRMLSPSPLATSSPVVNSPPPLLRPPNQPKIPRITLVTLPSKKVIVVPRLAGNIKRVYATASNLQSTSENGGSEMNTKRKRIGKVQEDSCRAELLDRIEILERRVEQTVHDYESRITKLESIVADLMIQVNANHGS